MVDEDKLDGGNSAHPKRLSPMGVSRSGLVHLHRSFPVSLPLVHHAAAARRVSRSHERHRILLVRVCLPKVCGQHPARASTGPNPPRLHPRRPQTRLVLVLLLRQPQVGCGTQECFHIVPLGTGCPRTLGRRGLLPHRRNISHNIPASRSANTSTAAQSIRTTVQVEPHCPGRFDRHVWCRTITPTHDRSCSPLYRHRYRSLLGLREHLEPDPGGSLRRPDGTDPQSTARTTSD